MIRRLFMLVVLAGLVYVAVGMWPDLQRYFKMRAM